MTNHSLRRRLLVYLLLAIMLAALTQAFVAYRSARTEADEIFDYHMQQMAMSLRSGLPANAGGNGGDAGDEDNVDFVVQVWTTDGLRIFQSTARPAVPERSVLGFSNVKVRGTTYRVFSLQARSQIIQVAQDMTVRREMASSLALRTVGPVVIMAPLLMLLVWWVIGSSLAPVARVQRQLAERQADGLGEVSESCLPDEIRPLVHELNLLFGRVRQAFEAQKSFVADAAHELRSPLAALRLQAQGLQKASDAPTRDLAIVRLMAGIDRATRLVEQLLVLARHQANSESSAPIQQLQLADIARLAVADAVPAAHARRIDLGIVAAQEGEVDGYPEALRILMRNLIENSVKYAPEGGRVDLMVSRQDDGMALTVEDSGPGIAPEDRDRVFDRFYRVAGSETTGSGLGLAIVKSIAELHGARLDLSRSERLGGLRVDVRFPSFSSRLHKGAAKV